MASPYALRRYHPIARVLIVAIPAGILLSLAYVAVWGDGNDPPPLSLRRVLIVSVCPSASHSSAAIDRAHRQWIEAGWSLPTPAPADCDGPPADGEVQVRGCGDVLTGWYPGCLPDHDGTAITREAGAVVYLERFRDRPCAVAHELGHAIGFGHATGASELMHSSCGTRMPRPADYP